MGIEIYKPNLRAAMEKDLSKISKGDLNPENLFYLMRSESLKIFEHLENNIEKLQESLEKFLSTANKNLLENDYVKLIETAENNQIETDEDKKDFTNKKIFADDNNLNKKYERIDISKEIEENEKAKSLNEEIISNLLGNKNKNTEENKKKNFENNLRSILKVNRKEDESESESEEEGKKNNLKNFKEKKIQYNNNKDILELNIKCPVCKICNLKFMKNKKTECYFIGCKGFPNCSHSASIDNPNRVVISNNICEKCEKGSETNFLYELEYKNLNGAMVNKEECIVCLLKNKKEKDKYKNFEVGKSKYNNYNKNKNFDNFNTNKNFDNYKNQKNE